MRLDPSTLVLAGLALVFAVVAYFKDPSLPLIGARNGLSMLGFVLPRLVPALLLAGLFQVVVPQEIVSRYFGREAGDRKSTRLNSSHSQISYAVFCLKKKKKQTRKQQQ